MDISSSIIPKSDQWNADDLVAGPRTVTVAKVSQGSPEQPVNVHIIEDPKRAYRPSKSMRRVLAEVWGTQSDNWVGKSLTLFRNPNIKFGGETVGGIEISHMSHIDKPITVSLSVTRGKRKPFTVKPLQVAQTTDWAAVIPTKNAEELRNIWQTNPEARELVEAEVARRKEESE